MRVYGNAEVDIDIDEDDINNLVSSAIDEWWTEFIDVTLEMHVREHVKKALRDVQLNLTDEEDW